MNENLFVLFIAPTILGLFAAVLIILFFFLLIFIFKYFINNRLITTQQWLIKLTLKQMMAMHNTKGRTWFFMLVFLIIFIVTTNLFGLLPYLFTLIT